MEAGTALKQQAIDFRELLERVLPLDDLLPRDRHEVRRALESGVQERLARAAHLALSALEHQGALRRLPEDDARRVRFAAREGLDVITVPRRSPGAAPPGIVRIRRPELLVHARASLEQVRGLLHLDDRVLFAEPGHRDVPSALAEPLIQIGREFLGTDALAFIPADYGERSIHRGLARLATEHPDEIIHCPDVSAAPWLTATAAARNVAALVMAAVRREDGRTLGHLEVLSPRAGAFQPADLSLVALLADHTAALLSRGSRIEKMVFIDPMTSVYNRSYFDMQLANEMARADRERASMALCIADIDDFKSFNTAYGYEAGNTVLTRVAQAFKSGVRPFDAVARWGGEEFCVLLTAPVQAGDVRAISERLRNLVARESVNVTGLDGRAHSLHVTVSIGVALFPGHGTTPRELWRAANEALLQAKRPPKNRVVFYGEPGAPGR